jgi:hypothetical protein
MFPYPHIHDLILFSGYVTCTLDDAKLYANHAKKKVIDMKDVKLASQMLLDKAFTTPPPRDVTILNGLSRRFSVYS